MSRNSSKVVIEENDHRENIPAEECIESRAYRINAIIDPSQVKDGPPRQFQGHMSSRSGDATKKCKLLRDSSNPMRVIKVKNITRARNTGSVDAQKQRDKSLISTQQSTPQKGEDF